MGWAFRDDNDFKVGEAIDASRLLRKRISIYACRSLHHVVSYYTESDAPSLAWPSRVMQA
jgi:hypothetical protein